MNCTQCERRLNVRNRAKDDPEFCVRCFRRIDEISLAQGLRLLLAVSPETQRTPEYKERETFYFMQTFHPEHGEDANRRFAREISQ